MLQSKLISIFKTLTKQEIKSLHKFLRSPYFNTNESVVLLFEYLRKTAPHFLEKKLTKEAIYKHLFPKKTFNLRRLKWLANELTQLIEQFWLYEKTKQNITAKHLHIANSYEEKGFKNYWQQSLIKTQETCEKSSLEAEKWHYYQWQIALSEHIAIENKEVRTEEPNLQAVHHSLDAFYLCSKLKYYCKVLNYQRFQSRQYDIRLIETVLEEAQQDIYKDFPAIRIYYHGIQTLLSIENESDFEALKQLLQKHSKQFDVAEIQNMFVLARNFCIKHINQGHQHYGRKLLNVYKIEIENGLLLINGRVPDATCKNIVMMALHLQETDWVIHFLETYEDFIDEEVLTFNKAFVFFQQKRYKQVSSLLEKIDFKEGLLRLSAKGLQLRTYYELYQKYNDDFEYEEKLELFLRSFYTFLNRKKEHFPRHYIYYINLTSFIKKLFMLHYELKIDKDELEKISNEVENTIEVTEKDWLREKIAEVS